MRDQALVTRWRRAALMAALVLIVSGCAAAQNQSSASPSPSPSPSPSQSPSPSPVALAITSAGFHAGEVGVAYAPVTPAASGGAPPFTWMVSAGVLPGGLAIGSDGTVAGKPSRAGSFHFTLQVADSAGAKVALSRSVRIAPFLKLTLVPACAAHCSVEIGCVNVCGRFGTVTGGLPPYRYALTDGYVPAGTSQSGLSLKGTFGGSPSRGQFTVAVTDALGVTKTISPSFFVYAHISLANGTCSVNAPLTSCTVQLRYLGSIPGTLPTVKPISWSPTDCIYTVFPAICATQPTFTATVQSGPATMVTITLTDSPSWPYTTGSLKLLITDKDPCGAGTYCSGKATLTVVYVG